jgi:hypothetical protein
MQIDWATHGLMRIGDCTRKLHYFAAVLCYSRLLFVEFFLEPKYGMLPDQPSHSTGEVRLQSSRRTSTRPLSRFAD